MGWIDDIKNAIGGAAGGIKMLGQTAMGDSLGATTTAARTMMGPKGIPGGSSSSFGGSAPAQPNSEGLNTRYPWQQSPQYPDMPNGNSGMETGGNSQEDMYQSLIDELMGKINREYTNDGSSDALVDQAFQGSLDALGNARTRTNDNFNTSRENIDSLTNSHVANIKGADRDAVNRIGSDLTSSYGEVYGANEQGLKDDRAEEIALKTDMLKRLGIQDAGAGTVGQVQTQGIADNSANRADALQQAEGYKAADLTRNVEQAQSMSNAGVERQGDLRRQLDGILGGLDTQEANIQNDISTAKLSGRNADRADFQKEQGYYNDSLSTILSDQSNRAESKRDFDYQAALDAAKMQQDGAGAGGGGGGGGSNSMFDVLKNQIASSTGQDATPYISAYNQAMAEGGGPLQSGVGDKNSYMYKRIQEIMAKNGQQADLDTVSRVVNGVTSYGTDKLNAG